MSAAGGRASAPRPPRWRRRRTRARLPPPQTLGRLATLAAKVIRGKHTPLYHPAMDMGCYVVVINADKVEVTGKKENQKTYFRHTQNKRSGAGRCVGVGA